MTILYNCINRNTNTNIQTHTHTHTHTSYHIISYQIISYHIISYHIIYIHIYIYIYIYIIHPTEDTSPFGVRTSTIPRNLVPLDQFNSPGNPKLWSSPTATAVMRCLARHSAARIASHRSEDLGKTHGKTMGKHRKTIGKLWKTRGTPTNILGKPWKNPVRIDVLIIFSMDIWNTN